jgi:ribosomal protein S7
MSVKENRLKTSFKNKLIEEMYSILNDKESKSVNKKEYILKEAAENKGNVHYRW